MDTVYWRVFFNTKRKQTAERLMQKLVRQVGTCEVLSFKPYWKDDNLFEVELRQDFDFQLFERSMAEFFKLISVISDVWEVNFANAFTASDQNISVVSSGSFKFDGIHWASVSLGNSNMSIVINQSG